MTSARRAVLQVLNNEWSRGVWKHWLSNIFVPPVEPPMPAPASVRTPTVETVNTAPKSDATGSSAPGAMCAEAKVEPPDSSTREGKEERRVELRARFEALSDRLMSLEDGVETLLRRSGQREKAERRSELQRSEVMENLALLAERQASVLEGLLGTVSRLEHALSRLEHGLSRVERSTGERSRRDSYFPAGFTEDRDARTAHSRPSSAPHFQESGLAPKERAPASVRASGDADDPDLTGSSSINGFLSEVSLSTVLAMLELERHSGRLKVATDDGMMASFELAEGSVVSSRLSENDADPLQTLRTALCWKNGRFWFRQQPSEAPSFPPRSIGSLLLEATQRNDESFADVANG